MSDSLFGKKNSEADEVSENKETAPENEENTTEENSTVDAANKTGNEEDWQSKYAEANDKYLRLYSEFDNYRKRTVKERIELANTASEEVIKALLPIIDDFERALKSEGENKSNEGFKLIYQKLLGNLTRKGLEPMETKGKEFDADIHDAITNAPASSEDLVGKVIDELEKGYYLHGKVIRHAKVIVGS